MRPLAKDERRNLRRDDPGNSPGSSLFVGTANRVALVSESGLYKLILRALDCLPAGGATNWMRPLADHEKRRENKTTLKSSQGWTNKAWLISESGLYKLILRANSSPTATAFQNWVTREVLPSIRKSGAYVAGQETLAPDQQAEMSAMVADLVARMSHLLDREESRQKAEEARKVAVTTDFTTVREFLEDIGVSMKQDHHSAPQFHRTGPSRLPARGHAPAPRWPSAPHPLCSPGLPRGAGGLAVGAGR